MNPSLNSLKSLSWGDSDIWVKQLKVVLFEDPGGNQVLKHSVIYYTCTASANHEIARTLGCAAGNQMLCVAREVGY
jgi:hypothetical protein